MIRRVFVTGSVVSMVMLGLFLIGNFNGIAMSKTVESAKGTVGHILGGNPQTKCPVMGGTIDPEMYVDVKGKRIYICCMACEEAIKVEPDKYISKIESRGETVEVLQ